MKLKILILFAIVFYSFLYSEIYEIKQDGSGDFTTIQAGIDEAADNDTVLVYPGTYFENVIILEKSLTLGSLTLTTGDDSYKHTTIIDGNQTSSCIQVRGEYTENYEPVFNDSVCIVGFTMQHGEGTSLFEDTPNSMCGGGILNFYSITKISDCIIKENTSLGIGGGVDVFESKTYLSGISIYKNKSRSQGGGIGVAGMNHSENSRLYFDNENLCNIYNNYGDCCNDFFKGEDTPFIDVIVDTFTVSDPSSYYLAHIDSYGHIHPELINLSMQHAYFEQIAQDIYVSPEGNDSNSGLSIDDPFQTIAHALIVIKSDSLNYRKIYLSNGIYSQNLNNQWLPIHAKEYVSIIGESMENTIIDAEELSGFIFNQEGNFSYTFSNLKFINGNDTRLANIFFERFGESKCVNFENINIENSKTQWYQISTNRLNVNLCNINLSNNFDNGGIMFCNSRNTSNEKITLTNCRIIQNYQWNNLDVSFYARPISFIGVTSNNPDDFSEYTMINCEINNCHDNCHLWPESAGAIFTAWNSKINIINCTIGDNSSTASLGAAICGLYENSIMNIYNSIIYGNTPRQIVIANAYAEESGPYILNIKNSLIQEGEEQVYDAYGGNEINWLGGNLRENPLWNISDDSYYFLSEDSPCIDAGTLYLPDGIELPEFDLAGNPRIYGNAIDMGAYEWNPNIANEDNFAVNNERFKLSNYPNPFNSETKISFNLPATIKNLIIEIFNIKGEKIRTINCQNQIPIIWDGTDNFRNQVSSGVYLYRLKANNFVSKTKKMTLLK